MLCRTANSSCVWGSRARRSGFLRDKGERVAVMRQEGAGEGQGVHQV